MPKYDWEYRFAIEHRPANYVVYSKKTGQAIYDGIAEDAYNRLALNHPHFIPGTFVDITYRRGDISLGTLHDEEIRRIQNSRNPRKNIQNNPNLIRLCSYPGCHRKIKYPDKYCFQHSGNNSDDYDNY